MVMQIFITRLIMILFSVVPIIILIVALYIDHKTSRTENLDTYDNPIRQIYIEGQGWMDLSEYKVENEKEHDKLLMELILKDTK